MRLAALQVFLVCLAGPLSNGQTVPGLGSRNTKDLPPIVVVQTEVEPVNAKAVRQRLLADLKELIAEAQTLQEELNTAPAGTVAAQSFKRAQKMESLSRKIRKALKVN